MEEIVTYLFETYKMDGTIIKKKAQRSKPISEIELVREIGIYALSNDLEWSKSDRENAVKSWIGKLEAIKTKPKSDFVLEFISHTFLSSNISISPNQIYTQEGIQIDENDVTTILEAKMFDWNRENETLKISAPELKAKLKDISRETAFNTRKELIDSLAFDCNRDADKWMRLSYRALKIQEEYEIYKIMLSHWIWMVKRKMLALPTKNQFVLNYYGKPSCGKSFFVKLLTSPVAQFRHNNADLNMLQDDRSIPALGSNFVHFLDELCTGTTKTISSDQELAKIKNIITADTDFKYRPMGSNAEQRITPKTSLIAASNFHIFDVIMDSSGMRRWFEFNVGLEPNTYDIDLFDKMRFSILDLWKGIDEKKDEGYLDVHSLCGKAIYKIQDSYVKKDSFTLWVESIDILPGKMRGPEAHELYTQYCLEEGYEHKARRIQSFYQRLAAIGVDKKEYGGYTYVLNKIVKKSHNSTHKEEEIVMPKTKNRIQHIEGIE